MEIVDPRTLRPLDEQTIVRSVRKTHRAVVVDSGLGFVGLHSEIASVIAEQAFDDLDAPVERAVPADAPTPHAKKPRALEDADARQDRGRGAPRLPCERELSGCELHQFLDECLRDVRADAQRTVRQRAAVSQDWLELI